MESKAIRIVLRVTLAALVVWGLVSRSGFLRANVAERDSVAYWAAGQLLLQHQDPYQAEAVLELEQQHGYRETKPLVLRTPPWSLFMTLPLGMVDAFTAWILWVLLSIGSLVLAMRLCSKMYGDPRVSQNLVWIAGYSFAPVSACLVAGQMGLVLLLGVVLFLWLESKYPLFAGMALLLPFAKPHLFAIFWFALVVWIVTRKRYAVGLGFALSLVVSSAVAAIFDPHIFSHYREMLDHSLIGAEFIPAISGVLRLLFFRRFFWVQFIPMMAALAWSVRFCLVHRHHWEWREHGLSVIVVSVLTTPYSWLTDEVVLLPAILQAVVWVFSAKEKMAWKTRLMLTLFVGLNGLLLLILAAKVPFSTGIYFWSSLVWAGFYAYSRKHRATASSFKPGPTAELAGSSV